MSDDGIRSPSRQYIRREEFVVMWLDPQDLLDQPELDISDEQMQRVVESVHPIIDDVFDVARADAEHGLLAMVAPDDPKLKGHRW